MISGSLNLYRNGVARVLGRFLVKSMFVCSVGVFHARTKCIEPLARLAVFPTWTEKYEDNGNVSLSDLKKRTRQAHCWVMRS